MNRINYTDNKFDICAFYNVILLDELINLKHYNKY